MVPGLNNFRRHLSRGRSSSDPEGSSSSAMAEQQHGGKPRASKHGSRSSTPAPSSTSHHHHHNLHSRCSSSSSAAAAGGGDRGRTNSVGASSVTSDQASLDSDDSHIGWHHDESSASGNDLPPPVLVYHESARSIVFRDHVRRAERGSNNNNNINQSSSSIPNVVSQSSTASSHVQPRRVSSYVPKQTEEDLDGDGGDEFHELKARNHRLNASESHVYIHQDVSESFSNELTEMAQLFGAPESVSSSIRSVQSVEISGFQPTIVPLPKLSLGPNDEFEPLFESTYERRLEEGHPLWTEAELEVYQLLMEQHAVVKTVKNNEWTPFLYRFKTPREPNEKYPNKHDDIPAHDDFPFNSFVTPCSLLPPGGRKMRAYGANSTYTTGVVFALPSFPSAEAEDQAAKETRTWSWPAGYAAKTEFNRSQRGELINGREEALVSMSKLREYNIDYATKDDYVVAGRMLHGGLKTVPYNEIFLRVGGPGRIVNGRPVAGSNGSGASERSFDRGVGLPVALFVRTAQYGHLISLLRIRARLQHIFGAKHVEGLPLLMITPDNGIRVLTEKLQHELLKVASRYLNPFQNSQVSHKTKINDTDPMAMQTKLEELIHLDDKIRETLTKEELARLAGGFGATDDSIAGILRDAMIQDKQQHAQRDGETIDLEESHELQDIVNEGLAAAVRSGDYYTSRQLLILYSLVASEGHHIDMAKQQASEEQSDETKAAPERRPSLEGNAMVVTKNQGSVPMMLCESKGTAPPPPPPLDTDRLRSATNSDGLLAVLGAAQILRAIQDGSAKRRTEECFVAVEEWVDAGEQSIAFRLASWTDQRAAQKDLAIAVNADSSFMAFVSGKAIANRKNFARQLREAVERTDFSDMRFLTAIYEITNRMHSPCLRLELLQYALGLDNRYSIAHVKRAVELAATCLSISVPTP